VQQGKKKIEKNWEKHRQKTKMRKQKERGKKEKTITCPRIRSQPPKSSLVSDVHLLGFRV
jgi:hypothetical protein